MHSTGVSFRVSTSRKIIFTIAACCIWQTPELLALFKLGVLKKVWFRPQVGNSLLFNRVSLSVVIHARRLFTNLSPFIRVLGVTLENSHSFYPENQRVLAASLTKTRVKTFGNASVSRRGTHDHDTLSPLLFLNRKLKKSSRQWGSLTTRSWVVTAWPTLRKNAKNRLPTLPRWFPSAESAQCAEESSGRSGLERRWLLSYVGWIQSSVLHDVCDCNLSDSGFREFVCPMSTQRYCAMLCQDEESHMCATKMCQKTHSLEIRKRRWSNVAKAGNK